MIFLQYIRNLECCTAMRWHLRWDGPACTVEEQKYQRGNGSVTETRLDIPWTLQCLYTGMSLSEPSGGSKLGWGVGSKRLSMETASSKPISSELKLLCVSSSLKYLLENFVRGPAALMLASLVWNLASITTLPSKTRQASLMALKVS